MASPTASDVHIDAALSQISIAFKNQGYIADRMFPIIQVPKQSDKYFTWTKDFWFRNYVQQRTPGDSYPEGSLEISSTAYQALIHHLAFPLPDEVLKNADAAADPERAGAEWLADQFMLNREALFVADHFKTTVWGTDKTLAGTDQWSDYANSDPIADLQTAGQTIQKSTGLRQKDLALTMGQEVFDTLKEHPLLLDKYKYTQVPILTEEQVAGVLGVKSVLVGSAIDNSAKEGATFVGEYMWGKSALLLYTPPSPGLMVPSGGYTFVWNIDGGELAVQVQRIREDNRDRDLLKAKHAFDQIIVAKECGYFFAAAVA